MTDSRAGDPQQILAMLASAGVASGLVTALSGGSFSVALQYGGRVAFSLAEDDGGWDWTRYDADGEIEDQGYPETSAELVSDLLFSLSLTD
jgi:hypothetical protein